jgi:hypothetical protein
VATVRVRTNVYWPAVADARLDALVAAASNAGEKASRAEVLAALVWTATTDGEGLGVMVREYRRKVRKAPEATLELRRPGPRLTAP